MGETRTAEVTSVTSGWLHTDGGTIRDTVNNPYVIKSISWFGLETPECTPHGLWSINLTDGLRQIKGMGFNTIRLPYSNECITTGKTSSINYSANLELEGKDPLQVMDSVIAEAEANGLNVILDRHRPDSASQSELWYTDGYSEEKWITDWKMLAARYKDDPTVIGVDLHNEPRGAACWGCGNPVIDWQAAATRAGDAVLSVNPNLLIIVEGIENESDGTATWWGSGLKGVAAHPVRLTVDNRVVYSPHDYPGSIYPQKWFSDPDYPANLPGVWDENWGYIAKQGIAPVLLGEFGSRLETASDKQWLDQMVKYLGSTGISYSYWSYNPNSGDTGGLVKDDWRTPETTKLTALDSLLKQPLATQPKLEIIADEVIPLPPVITAPLSREALVTPFIDGAAELVPALGDPVSEVICGLKDNGCSQSFQRGEILWSATTGAQISRQGAIRATYRAAGAENGVLGYPTSAEICGLRDNGCYQSFQRGEILWSATTGAHVSRSGGIRQAYRAAGAENGILGYPRSSEICGLKGGGCYQSFQRGEILWSATTGAHVSRSGGIRTTYRAAGAENGILGYPRSPEICGLKGGGCYQSFQRGEILWSATTGAVISRSGGIRNAYRVAGAENGVLGYPTNIEICGLRDNGCYQSFQNGEILWSAKTNAHATVTGPIRTTYRNQGAENGALGYPTTAQACATTTQCTQTFQTGTLTWTPTTDVRMVRR